MLTDTHCHIHEAEYPQDGEAAYARAIQGGVKRLICVGTTVKSSTEALQFAESHENAWASIAMHPHEAAKYDDIDAEWAKLEALVTPVKNKLVAIGECGLDYFYHKGDESRKKQQYLLRKHLVLAQKLNLPLIFHVRDAFDDFWPIFNEYGPLKGVLHSFTDTKENADIAIKNGLFIGVNGISTFTKDPAQQAFYAQLPLKHMVLETDAPYLTPTPLRGSINEPVFVTHVAHFHAAIRGVSEEVVASATSHNATKLFSI